MDRLWSDDMVVTNPLNRFVNKQQVLGMMRSGSLEIPKYDRQIEYIKTYGDIVIVAGPETVSWGAKCQTPARPNTCASPPCGENRRHWQEVARHANIVPQSPQ